MYSQQTRERSAHVYQKPTSKSCRCTKSCTTNATQELYMDNNAPKRKSARLIFSLKREAKQSSIPKAPAI
jgi:hypothetical protein